MDALFRACEGIGGGIESRAASFDGAQDEGEYSIHFLILSLSKDEETLDAEFLHALFRGNDGVVADSVISRRTLRRVADAAAKGRRRHALHRGGAFREPIAV